MNVISEACLQLFAPASTPVEVVCHIGLVIMRLTYLLVTTLSHYLLGVENDEAPDGLCVVSADPDWRCI